VNTPLTVSELNNQINGLLETTFSNIYLEGEISNLTYHNSGHIYFSVKDDKSTISCVMFRGNAKYLKFRLEMGAKIIITGNITVYVPRGSYQVICTKIEPSGIGELALAYEQLKTKLQIKGYFDKSLKKELPKFPKNIYVVTSNTGAAIEDMKKILAHRYPLARMVLIPTLVQGEGAKEDIVNSLRFADKLAKQQKQAIIIVGRGGGSIEDLWAFNEECVADTIHELQTPTISAVGHESDVVISDFVADVRASTPSNAIEISTPNIDELRMFTDSIYNEFQKQFGYIYQNKAREIQNLQNLFKQHSLEAKFEFTAKNITQLKNHFNTLLVNQIKNHETNINILKSSFEQNNPEKKSINGYVQVTKDNQLYNIDEATIDEMINLETSQHKFTCKILDIQKLD
jgi:exodeoxyribonuclease VII large subunit